MAINNIKIVPSEFWSESRLISISSVPSLTIQDTTDRNSDTKLGIWHFKIAAFPLRTYSSIRLTAYACETTETTILTKVKNKRIKAF